MDGENNGTPYEQMDDFEGKNPYFWFNTHMALFGLHSPPEAAQSCSQPAARCSPHNRNLVQPDTAPPAGNGWGGGGGWRSGDPWGFLRWAMTKTLLM